MSTTKSNAEIAKDAAMELGQIMLRKHRRDGGTEQMINWEFLDDAASLIESALTAAQSSLAKVVLDEVSKSAWPTANHDVGAHDVEDCTTCAAAMQATEVAKAVRDLFTRLNVPIGE